jgi:hypothetical protein
MKTGVFYVNEAVKILIINFMSMVLTTKTYKI